VQKFADFWGICGRNVAEKLWALVVKHCGSCGEDLFGLNQELVRVVHEGSLLTTAGDVWDKAGDVEVYGGWWGDA